MQQQEVWKYRDRAQLGFDPTAGKDIVGFHVEALDGSIGKVDESTNDTRAGATSLSTQVRGSSARK